MVAPDRTAVVLDLDGTLAAFDDYGAVLERACRESGIDPTPDLRAAYDDRFFAHLEALRGDPVRRAIREATADAGVDADPDAFAGALHDAECALAAVPDAVPATLDALADRGYALCVLTNGVGDWQRRKLARHGLADRFDAVTASYEAGAHKPDPAAFALAERRLPAERYVMVGDDEAADVVGARDAGWEAIHVGGPADLPDATASLR